MQIAMTKSLPIKMMATCISMYMSVLCHESDIFEATKSLCRKKLITNMLRLSHLVFPGVF